MEKRWLKLVNEEAQLMTELKKEKDAAVAAAAAAAAASSSSSTEQSPSQAEKNERKPTGFLSWFTQGDAAPAPAPKPRPVPEDVLASAVAPAVTVPTEVGATLTGHGADVSALAYNVNGSVLVSCAQDKTVRLWDTGSWTATATLTGATQGVNYACMSVADDLVLGCSNDKAARLWSVSGARLRHTLTGHQGKVLCGAFVGTSGRVVTSGQDKSVRVWDAARGAGVKTMICYSTCLDLAPVPCSSLLATAHLDGALRTWDLTRCEAFSTIDKCHDGHVTCCTPSSDGRWLLTCGRDNVLHIYDPTSWSVVATLRFVLLSPLCSHTRSSPSLTLIVFLFLFLQTPRVLLGVGQHARMLQSRCTLRRGRLGKRVHLHLGHHHDEVRPGALAQDFNHVCHPPQQPCSQCCFLFFFTCMHTNRAPATCVAWHPTMSCIAVATRDAIDVWK